MKGARFWAIFMAGLLTFSTLANDYMVVNAEEIVEFNETIEENTEATEAAIDEIVEAVAEESDEELVSADITSDEEIIGEDDENTGEEELDEEDADEEEESDALEELEEGLDDAELEYPEANFEAYAAGMNIQVVAPKGALPEGTVMIATAVSADSYAVDIENEISEDEEIQDLVAVDISFMLDGEEIEPKAAVEVRFVSAAAEAEDIAVFHDNETTDSLEQILASVKGNDVVINAAEFSVYVVAKLGNTTGDELSIKGKDYSTTLKVGESKILYIDRADYGYGSDNKKTYSDWTVTWSFEGNVSSADMTLTPAADTSYVTVKCLKKPSNNGNVTVKAAYSYNQKGKGSKTETKTGKVTIQIAIKDIVGGNIKFHYDSPSNLSDSVSVGEPNTMSYTIEIVDAEGNYIGTTQGQDFETGSHVNVSEALFTPHITAPDGYMYEFDSVYFYWSGQAYKGTKVAVSEIKNFGTKSTTHSDYDSYLGYKSSTAGYTGSDYSEEGYFAYNPTGTLMVVYKQKPGKSGYTINHFKQNADGTYPSDPTETSDIIAATTNETIKAATIKTYAKDYGTAYALDEAKSDIKDLKIKPLIKDNVVNLYYKNNEVGYTVNHYKQVRSADKKTFTYELAEKVTTGKGVVGTKATATEKEYPGYTAKEGNVKEITLVATAEKNVINLYYDLDKYTLTINPNGGTYDSKSANTVLENLLPGDVIDIADPTPVDGYRFDKWTADNATFDATTKKLTMGSADATLTASYKLNKYTVEVYVQTGAGFMSPLTQDAYSLLASKTDLEDAVDGKIAKSAIEANDEYKIADAPVGAYELKEITSDLTLTDGKYELTDIDADNVIKVYYDLLPYTVELNLSAGEKNSPATEDVIGMTLNASDYAPKFVKYENKVLTYTYASNSFELPMLSAQGFTFLGWNVTGSSSLFDSTATAVSVDPTTLTNYSYTAKWAKASTDGKGAYIRFPQYATRPVEITSTTTHKSYPEGNYTSNIANKLTIAGFITGQYDSYVESDLANYFTVTYKKGTYDSGKTVVDDEYIYITENGKQYKSKLSDLTYYVIKNAGNATNVMWHIDGELGSNVEINPYLHFVAEVEGGSASMVTLSKTDQVVNAGTALASLQAPTFEVPEGFYFAGFRYGDTLDKSMATAVGSAVMPENETTIYVVFKKLNPLTLTAGSYKNVYDGLEHEVVVEGIPSDLTITGLTVVNASTNEAAKASDVTKFTTKIVGTPTIMQGDVDVTERYAVTYVDGEFEITPATAPVITVTGATKEYDGEALTAAGTYTFTKSGDSVLVKLDGKNIADDVTQFADMTSGLVDGDTLTVVVEGEATHVADAGKVTIKSATISSAKGDVTKNYESIDTTASADLVITARPITITALDYEREYDGNEITFEEVSKFFGGDDKVYTIGYTGDASKKAVVDSDKATVELSVPAIFAGEGDILVSRYDIKPAKEGALAKFVGGLKGLLGGSEAADYDVTVVAAKAKVTVGEMPLVLTANSSSADYDGLPHAASGYRVASSKALALELITSGKVLIIEVTAGESQIEAGDYMVGFTGTPVLMQNGVDVTKYFQIQMLPGHLIIYREYAPIDEGGPSDDSSDTPTYAIVPTQAPAAPAQDADVLGARRPNAEADESSVLGARRPGDDGSVLGARRNAATGDENSADLYWMLMCLTAGVGAAYGLSRKREDEEEA